MSKGFIISILLLGTACGASARPDLNAFLNKRAKSVAELVAQVKSDKEVMDRYCRHYSMAPSEVIQHLRGLRLGKIARSDIYVVYSVPEGGALKSHLETLKAGTPVFVSPSGRPELLVKCGNPLTKGPKKPEMANSIAASVATSEVVEPQSLPVDAMAVIESAEPSLPTLEPSIATLVEQPGQPEQGPTGEPGTSEIPILTNPSSTFNPLALLLLPAAGISIDRGETSAQPVPEPTSLAGLGLGAAALIAYRRRRK